MDKICVLTRELLPLYAENACSSAVAGVIEEHLSGCAECRAQWNALRAPLPGESAATDAAANALAPAAPFVRVWRRALRRAVAWVLVAALAVTALFLTVCTLRGDGYTWFTLPAYITAEKLADAVVDMDPVRMNSCISFTGVGPQDELQMRERLLALAQDGYFILEGWSELRRCAADDGIQELSVFFTVDAQGQVYTVEFPGSLWELWRGKAALRRPLVMDDSTGRYVEPLWLDSLADALCTHDPG